MARMQGKKVQEALSDGSNQCSELQVQNAATRTFPSGRPALTCITWNPGRVQFGQPCTPRDAPWASRRLSGTRGSSTCPGMRRQRSTNLKFLQLHKVVAIATLPGHIAPRAEELLHMVLRQSVQGRAPAHPPLYFCSREQTVPRARFSIIILECCLKLTSAHWKRHASFC